MKKVSELVMFTLFFSSLGGFGITAGFFCYVFIERLFWRLIG